MPVTKYKSNALKESLLKAHEHLKLTGDPPNELLLNLPDSIITYLHAFMKQTPLAVTDLSRANWDAAIQALSSHGILPLLYRTLYDLPEEHHPKAWVMDKLRFAFQASSFRVIAQTRQLRSLLSAMNQAGEKILIVKGPSLSGSLYPMPATRPCNDIDILVLPEQFKKARQVLSGLGYTCKADRFDRYRDLHSEECFVHQFDKTFLPVELHWDIHHLYGFRGTGRVHELFDRAVRKSFEGLSFDGLDPVDELIHLVLHLTLIHTRDIRLIWLYDIHLLSKEIERIGMWGDLKKRCGEWRATFPVFYALQLTETWTGLRLPKEIENQTFFPKTAAAEEIQWKWVLTRYKDIRAMTTLRFPPGLPLWKKIKYMVDFAFPPKENLKKRYAVSHDFLMPFYYFRRFIDRFVRRNWKR